MTAWRARATVHLRDHLYRQSYLMLGSTGVSAVTGLLFWILAAHETDARTVGLGAGLVASVAFLSYLTSFALPYGMLRFARASKHISGTLNYALWFSALTSVLAAAAFSLGSPVWAPKLHVFLRHGPDLLLFAGAGAGAALGLLLDNALASRRRGGVALARNAVAGVGKLICLPLLAHLGARGIYLALTGPQIVSAVAVWLALPRLVPGYRFRDFSRSDDVRQLFDFSLRNYPAALLGGAPTFLLPVIAVGLLSARDNAFFYVAWSIGQVVQLLPSVISNLTLSEGVSEGPAAAAARSQRFALTMLLPLCLLGALLASPLLLVYGRDYQAHAAWPLRCFVLSAIPWASVVIWQSRLRIERRFGEVVSLTAVLCVLSLALAVGLGARFGVAGIGAGWLLAMVLAALLVQRRKGRVAQGVAGTATAVELETAS